jgi:5-methylcytosine-specific restriction protein A
MLNRAPIQCNYPSCQIVVEPGTGYCAAHTKRVAHDRRAADNSRYQNQPWRALYHNESWRILREFVLSRDPLCKLQTTDKCKQHCGDESTVADHIRDHKGDTKLFYDRENLRGVCKPCHDRKTGETRGDSDPNAPVATGAEGKQWISSMDSKALDAALAREGY